MRWPQLTLDERNLACLGQHAVVPSMLGGGNLATNGPVLSPDVPPKPVSTVYAVLQAQLGHSGCH